MFIRTTDGQTTSTHIGSSHVKHMNAQYVISVQCDGDELSAACIILNRTTTERVFTFFGDNAREVVANWR